jgi:hypothetical protein
MESELTVDINEILIRIVKYIFEGVLVGLVASLLPSKNQLSINEIFILGLSAAAAFAVLDMISPNMSGTAKQGAALGTGFRLVGFGA